MKAETIHLPTAPGISITVTLAGQGPLVVLVHGFPESWYSWRHQIETLAAAGYRVAALHVRGYGESSKPEAIEAYRIVELAGDVAAVIAALSPEGAAVVGHDWGAVIAQATALLHPEKVRALATLSVPTFEHAARPPSEVWPKLYGHCLYYMDYFQQLGRAEAEFEPDLARFVRIFFHSLSAQGSMTDNVLFRPLGAERLLDGLPDPAAFPAWFSPEDVAFYADSFRQGGMRGPLNRYRCVDRDWHDMAPYAARRITQPGLFIAGRQEPTRYMVPGVDRFDDPVPRMTDVRGVHVLKGAGHWVQQERAADTSRLLVEFLDGL